MQKIQKTPPAEMRAHTNMKMLQTEFLKQIREVTAEKYEYMLGVLPPERLAHNAFLVGEPYDHKDGHERFQGFADIGDKFYYLGLMTTKDFDTFTINVEQI